ncbi:unnamed protein product [Adineta steineri]|uniref:Protein ECT2-like n=1 Tax=Adineta steineri TaxID=433720 RepID=A0A813ZPS7_9BILA|nr:unnamed protein product [Adineta steineri]CAF1002409.1 unnamed protein product [Adineta steineri]CAF1246421.1 unnamed protein product [Adineta steineri]
MDDIPQHSNDDWSITFCIIGTACSNTQLLTALDDRYVFECINNERDIIKTLSDIKHSLSKRQLRIFIIDSFDDKTFYSLKDNDNMYIISSELVLICAEKKIDIPVPRRNRPLYSQQLESAVVCFVGSIRREIHAKFSDIVHYLGGSVRKDYNEQVTHVISFANLGEKYLTAFNMEKSEILTEDWLLECWKQRNNRLFNAFDTDFLRQYRAKPLHNLCLFFFDTIDDTEQHQLHTLTLNNGGFTTTEMSDATHIIFCNGTDVSTFLSTYPSFKRKHRQYIVNVQWFWECLCLMGKADESIYSIKIPGMNEQATSESPRLILSTSLNDSNYLQATSVKRKRRKDSDSNNETTVSPNSKRFNNSNENEDGLNNDDDDDDDNDQLKIVNIKRDNKYLIGMEIRDTERNYVTMLGNIIRIFKTEMENDDRRNGPILTKVESTQIFGNIEEIYHLHLTIAEQLDRAINEDKCIGSVFLANTTELLRVYQPYTKFYDKTIQAIHSLEKSNSRFYAYLKICEHKSELGKQHLVDLMIRPIQRLPSVLLLLERLLKYIPETHSNYESLIHTIDKLRDVTKKLNDERGKTEKHLSLFSIVNSIENCPPELLAAHRDYLQKFNLIELSQELTGKRTHLILFLFSDCIEITKLRVNTWKTSVVKSYKHVALIQLSDIHSLFDYPSSNDEYEQFGMLCAIDGQVRQLIFRVADNNPMSISRSHLTDSITSLSAISSLNQTNKTEVLQSLAKALAEERCLLDKTSLLENIGSENRILAPLSSIDFMPDSDTLSTHSTISTTTTGGLNSVGNALRSGLCRAKSRLSRTFSFSPISSKNRLKKILTSNSSLLHLGEKDSNNFNSMKRLSVPSRQDSFTSERNFPRSPSKFMHSIQEH